MDTSSLFAGLLEFKVTRFLVADGLAAVLYYAVYVPLVWRRSHRYIVAAIVAFLPSFALSFAFQKYWVFTEIPTEYEHVQLVHFTIKSVVFLVANLLLLQLSVGRWRWNPSVAQVVVMTSLCALSYLVNDWMIFI